MGLLSLLGVGLVKGAKYLYKHRNEISTAASVVRNISDSSNSYVSDDYEEEYVAAPALPATPENGQVIELNDEQMVQLLAEIAEGLQKLEANSAENSRCITELKEGQTGFEDGIRANAEAIEKVKQDLVRLASSVNDNADAIAKLKKTIDKLDGAIAESYNYMALIKQDCERRIAETENQMKALTAAQAAYQKKVDEKCGLIFLSAIAAILLAIFL